MNEVVIEVADKVKQLPEQQLGNSFLIFAIFCF